VETVIAPFADALTPLESIPGINQRTAAVISAEIGVDMSAFRSAGHLASGAALCPGTP
jgi:transposase